MSKLNVAPNGTSNLYTTMVYCHMDQVVNIVIRGRCQQDVCMMSQYNMDKDIDISDVYTPAIIVPKYN